MKEKITEFYNNKDFLDTLANSKTFEEASALFAEHGVEISADDLAEIAKDATTSKECLDETMLDQVSGGGFLLGVACLAGGYIVGRIIERVTR